MNLEEGDEFQFAINSSWENQRGFGYLETIEKDGVTYFENSGVLVKLQANGRILRLQNQEHIHLL